MYFALSREMKGHLMAFDKQLLDILACPKCTGDLSLNSEEKGLVCSTCRLMYDIKDDIPILLIDEAHKLD